MVLTDWRQLRLLEEVDFGWKASINIIRTPSTEHVWPMWICVCFCLLAMWILPTKAGVRVFVSLSRAAMASEMMVLVLKCCII